MFKMPSHCSFRPNLHELWSKEGAGVKLGIWLLTTNPLKVGGLMKSDWGVLYIVKKIFLKVIRYYPCILNTNLIWKIYDCPKFWDNKSPNFGSHGEKRHLDVVPIERHRVYYRGGEWCLFSKVLGHVKIVLEVVPTKSATPFSFNLH
jgi:hypothetical protein